MNSHPHRYDFTGYVRDVQIRGNVRREQLLPADTVDRIVDFGFVVREGVPINVRHCELVMRTTAGPPPYEGR